VLACIFIFSLPIIHSVPASAQDRAAVIDALPRAAAWKQHLERDILPFWQTPSALGNPVGNFPTFRCNDGSLANPQSPCAEYLTAPAWIRGALGRQYVRMISRQAYLYGVAFHLTGEEKYLLWARAGVHYIIQHAFNNQTGKVTSYWQGGSAIEPSEQTSQDLAYSLVGLSFYYYLTRDSEVLRPILRIERYIRKTYYDPRFGFYRWKLAGAEAGRLELVAQLDQANAYMLLLTPLLPRPYQQRWRAELSQIARILRVRFYDRKSGMFVGMLTPKRRRGDCIFALEDTDFGHTIKAYWMLYFIGRVLRDGGLAGFARAGAPGILQWAYLPTTGSWATQPTCNAVSGGLDRTSTWWMSAELDQAALTFGINNSRLVAYIPRTYDFWLRHMVDHRSGEVWDELTVPDYTPRLPKVHLWKNGFHTAEHAMIGYIATSAIRSAPVTLYYAFHDCTLPPIVHPYYYDGLVMSHAALALRRVPGFCRVAVTFSDVR
jgi:mannose/cellobiose epimerase-like protein (N-acyl-D-glucosamine 2-epimerase family)